MSVPSHSADAVNDFAPINPLIEDELDHLDRLRPFPAIATNLMDLCNQDDADVNEIIQLIECEPTIATRVLSIANSPLYGASRVINTIAQAVVLLGFRSVSQVAVSIAAGELFAQGDNVIAERKGTFVHSLGCATVARVLAQVSKRCNPDEAFLCGILHDVGKLVFFDAVAEEYLDLLQNTDPGSLGAAERRVFGIDHAAAGYRCGLKWGLPPDISAAIGRHHETEIDVHEDALSLVTLSANCLAKSWGLGTATAENKDLSALPFSDLVEEAQLSEVESQARELFEAVRSICS